MVVLLWLLHQLYKHAMLFLHFHPHQLHEHLHFLFLQLAQNLLFQMKILLFHFPWRRINPSSACLLGWMKTLDLKMPIQKLMTWRILSHRCRYWNTLVKRCVVMLTAFIFHLHNLAWATSKHHRVYKWTLNFYEITHSCSWWCISFHGLNFLSSP